MPSATAAGDFDKALNLLIHDLRAPLSVAHGYLRLIRERRLSSDDDRDKAIEETIESLGRMARLCDEAASYLAASSTAPRAAGSTPVPAFLGRLADDTRLAGARLEIDGPSADSLRLAVAADLAIAVATIIAALGGVQARGGAASVEASVDGGEIRIMAGDDAGRRRLLSDAPLAPDPWRGGHGLALPLACLEVASAGGRVWTVSAARAVGVALPLERATP